MLIIPPPPFRKGQPKAKAAKTAPPAGLMLVDTTGPSEVGSQDIEIGLLFDVTEEAPLASVVGADPTKWWARWNQRRYRGYSIVNSDFNLLLVQLSPELDEDGEQIVAYDNNPSDVADVLGRNLSAFADFPI